MRAITIYQPWASLIAVRAKKYETRSWQTRYRGKIAIHAAKTDKYMRDYDVLSILPEGWAMESNPPYPDLMMAKDVPLGAVIATAELIGCWRIDSLGRGALTTDYFARLSMCNCGGDRSITTRVSGYELLFGDFEEGRYAWELANVQMLPEPMPCRGRQGLWDWRND